MKGLVFVAGAAVGMAAAAAAITSMYPDVSRRMARDGRRMVRMGSSAVRRMWH